MQLSERVSIHILGCVFDLLKQATKTSKVLIISVMSETMIDEILKNLNHQLLVLGHYLVY
jgi:hypothetical protein